MLGWDPLSIGPHGAVQIHLLCTASPPPQWCVPVTPAEIVQQEAATLGSSSPMISAMCITKMGRSQMLDIALRRFEAQTYPNKEIVVLYDEDTTAARAVVARHATLGSGTGARVIAAVNHKGKDATLGELRNQAIAATSGELIIQWDDDDWYSAKRVEMQYRALMASQGSDGVLLLRYTLYETLTGLIWCA
jgi:glycosyltransferase involved in cell wall biosynthesis